MNIENKKQVAILLLAIGLGFVAVVLTSQYVKKSVEQQTQILAQEYANQTGGIVQEMEFLKMELKKVATQQIAMAKEGPGDLAQPKDQEAKLLKFSLKTPQGKRALTVLIDSLSAVGGLINPGDFIDVIGQLNMPDPEKPKEKTQKVTTILFQNVQVLAVGTNFSSAAVDSASIYEAQQQARSLYITLALDPQEAALVTFAQDNGKLQLSLRGPNENETKILQVASWDTLSDFVLEHQGTELNVPKSRASLETVGETEESPSRQEVKPFIQIFKAGQQL